METASRKIDPQIEESWKEQLIEEFQKPYFLELKNFLLQERSQHAVYPPSSLIFNAFNATPFEQVKVVILGQDPYHGAKQAHGLCFSVQDGIKPPPSLQNIFKELQSDVGLEIPGSGNLEKWTSQGVFLLNAVLTVRHANPGSHQKKGWETFTDAVIGKLSKNRRNLVFMLWGRYAREKKVLIDDSKHFILEAPHPSPYSASSGFFGCKHFSKANAYLSMHGSVPVDWKL